MSELLDNKLFKLLGELDKLKLKKVLKDPKFIKNILDKIFPDLKLKLKRIEKWVAKNKDIVTKVKKLLITEFVK